MDHPAVLFLLGPTASGKTALACELVDALADEFRIELVSVDSALVYREMNIGTAKPDDGLLARYPHHLINLIAPTETYSAADFRRDALVATAGIVGRGNVPLLVGGTMMYVKALINGLSSLPPADSLVRAAIEADALRLGWPAMHARLASIDPTTATRLSPNDSQRIQRALEVHQITGVPISTLQTRDATADKKNAAPAFPFATAAFALLPSHRPSLHERIGRRFDAMLATGFVNEVRQLRTQYRLLPDMPSMRAVGYRQIWRFLDGEISQDAMREQGVAATRQLAKRQMTWLRSMPGIDAVDCLDPLSLSVVINRARKHLQTFARP